MKGHAQNHGVALRHYLVSSGLSEIVEGTMSGVDAWRRMHETGEVPPEFEELEAQAMRGWDEEPRQDGADSDQDGKAGT